MAILLLFLAFLFTPAVARMAGVAGGGEQLENKALAKFPELTRASVADASYGTALSDYVWDHLPFRSALLKWDHILDYYLFGDTPVPGQVVVGLNGFVYVQERVHGWKSGGETDPQVVIRAIKNLEATAKKEGIPLVVVISPNKASIYPEYLPEEFREWYTDNVLTKVAVLEDYADRDGTSLLNIWRLLREKKARLLDPAHRLPDERLRYVFRPHDRHWNLETGVLQGAAVVRAIEGAKWDRRFAPVLSGKYTYHVSEISEIYMKLGPLEPYDSFIENPLIDIVKRRFVGAVTVMESKAGGDLAPMKKTLLVLRDSFLNNGDGAPANRRGGGINSIAPFFEKSIFIHHPTAVKKPMEILKFVRQADLLVIQVVQGNMFTLASYNRVLRQNIVEMGKAKRARAKLAP